LDSLSAGTGGDTLDGGADNDSLSGEAGEDTIVGGAGADTLEGGNDNDTLDGGDGNDSLHGGAGNDSIDGGAGVNTINGGDGADRLRVDHDDVVTGDDGNDTLVAEAASATLTGGAGDDILDFRNAGTDEAIAYFSIGSGHDALAVTNGVYPVINKLNGLTVENSPYYGDFVESNNNVAYIDFGELNLADVHLEVRNTEFFAYITPRGSAQLRGGDWYTFDVYIVITATGESLYIGHNIGRYDEGQLHLHTGPWARGIFNDGEVSWDLTSAIIEVGGFIWNPPEAGNSTNGSDGPDSLTDGGGNDTVAGGGGDDIILANLIGSGGVNRFEGGDGADTLTATSDGQVIRFSALDSIEVVTAGGHAGVMLLGSNQGMLIDLSGTSLVGLERVSGGGGQDTIIGTAGDDRLSGGGGQDSVSAGAGNDLIFATLSGADSLDGGNGADTIVATEAQTAIQLGSITGVEAITSDGLAGVSIIGTSGADSFDFSVVTLSGITLIDTGEGADTLKGSAAADGLEGGDGNDSVHGHDGNDNVLGGTGNDTLDGGAGDDTLIGSDGDDVFKGGAGNDRLDGGVGVDTLDMSSVSGVTVDLGLGLAFQGSFSQVVIGVEKVIGGSGADLLIGNNLPNTLMGGAGNDTLQAGGGGADLLLGGTGADRFVYTSISDAPVFGIIGGIQDFSRAASDKISLVGIDADVTSAGDQAFSFIGQAAFSNVAGQLRYDAIGQMLVLGDVDGDGEPDFAFWVYGASLTSMQASDFLL